MPKQSAEAVESHDGDLESVRERIAELRDALSAYEGQNLTGSSLEKADAIAFELMNQEAALRKAVDDIHQERSSMPATPPEGYGGVAHVVPDSEKQPVPPAASDNQASTDRFDARDAA